MRSCTINYELSTDGPFDYELEIGYVWDFDGPTGVTINSYNSGDVNGRLVSFSIDHLTVRQTRKGMSQELGDCLDSIEIADSLQDYISDHCIDDLTREIKKQIFDQEYAAAEEAAGIH